MFVLFFLFGFITTMNNSTIDFLKNAFGLNDVQKQLPNTFFYGAYALSVPISLMVARIGYRSSILAGLAMISLGFFLCIPGVGFGYFGFLSAVSVFALGVAVLQVAAQPYVNILGSKETAASRLTMANALNSVATVIAPIFVAVLMTTPNLAEGQTMANSEIQAIVKSPFIGIGVATLVILGIMFFLKLPEVQAGEGDGEGEGKKEYKSSAFKYTHVWLGSLGIFVYMGIEIGIPSFFADFVDLKNLSVSNPTDMLKYYWGGLMVGRILGVFVLRKFKAPTILTACSIGGAAMVIAAILLSGNVAMWMFLGAGLFHSIMWPVIYSLALEDLGPHTKVASGIIATSVIGAAILTPIMGWAQTITGTVVAAISFMFVYYLYLVFFAVKGSKIR